ncbi:MAG: cysteine hydrolase family protein [Candidatus Hodarchaeota archaeon]
MISWTIPSRWKRVVVDIDTQKCFFSGKGKSQACNNRTVLANIRRVMAWTRSKQIYVVSTKQVPVYYSNFRGGSTNNLSKITYTLCNRRIQLDATDCTDLPIGILKRYDQVILCKRCVDPFEEPRVDRMLTELEVEEFILIGTLVESAVKATALGLLARRKNVKVLIDATSFVNKAAANIALKQIKAKGAKLIETQELFDTPTPHSVRK